MFSSVQVVLLFDVNSFAETSKNESDLEQNVTRLKLACLKLLTEFGAQTEKGTEAVRWACKYYDSYNFKPDTSRKDFIDFNRKSYEDFENELTDRYCKAFDRKQSGNDSTNTSDNYKPHYYTLRKSLQEVLLDYNWDRPDISSPVKTAKRKAKAGYSKLLEDAGPYNTIIVCTNVPQNLKAVKNFCGYEEVDTNHLQITADDFLGSILDPSMVKGLQEDKQICLNFVNLNDVSLSDEASIEREVTSAVHSGLAKLNGGLHSISNIVQTVTSQVAEYNGIPKASGAFPSPAVQVGGLGVQVSWWKKARCGRPRRPQPGPSLVWEDGDGISYMRAQLEVLAVHGSASQEWGSAVVVGVVRSSAVSILAVAGEMGHLYVCHAPNTIFTTLVHVLAKYQLSMVLKLSCGGIAVLCPWAGGVGCLAVISASGLAAPPLSAQGTNQESQLTDPHLLKFVAQTVEKCLKSASPHVTGEPSTNMKRFAANQTQRWYRPLGARTNVMNQIRKRRVIRPERKAMQERLQKRYRPQILQPLATGEIGPLDLIDITQPPVDPPPVSGANPNMSRAQQLVKKSHIVTAQQKVKEQRAEEEERVQATERRAAQASERARKSQALESQVLNAVSDMQDTKELVQSLVCLRDGDGMETDLFTTAQTIINLALMHVKNISGTNMEEGLRKVLGSGVLQTAIEISGRNCSETSLRQYKLQTLLHLELLWVLGYSSSSKASDDEEEEESRSSNIREYHVEEIMKMLRAISLRHNPTTMATFLQETVLENYVETLGEVLVEIYEELNQPLPEPLVVLTSDVGEVGDTKPSSVNSQDSSVKSYSSPLGSAENPGSGKSRDGRRMLPRHRSLKEASKRSIVVQKVTRTLSRTISEQSKPQAAPIPTASASNKHGTDSNLRNVRRNLFVLPDGAASKSKLQRSQTVGAIPVSKLRRSPRKKRRKSHAITPVKSRTVSASPKASHKTPIKGLVTPERGLKTPKSKRGGVLVPETPGEKVGQTIFTKHRVCKSTGTTLIGESPDVKRVSRTTPRRLQASLTVTRRNSFYSGARSRNWERAKTRLLADRIRGLSDRRSLDAYPLQSMNDASFLFSEIIPTDPPSQQSFSEEDEKKNNCSTLERKMLDYGLDNSTSTAMKERLGRAETSHIVCEHSSKSLFTNSPAKNTHTDLASVTSFTSGTDLRQTPVKRVRKALSLCTPTKTGKAEQSPRNLVGFHSSEKDKMDFLGFSTPGKEKLGEENRDTSSFLTCQNPGTPQQTNHDEPSGLSGVTPSKRVQFNLIFTPSKHVSPSTIPQTPKIKDGCFSSPPQTPKSILKTPLKTPGKTPRKIPFHSPDSFVPLVKRSMFSPLKTPLKNDKGLNSPPRKVPSLLSKPESVPETPPPQQNSSTPVKVEGIVSFSEGEIELLSPDRRPTTTKSSAILFTSPMKVHPIRGLSERKMSPEKIDNSKITVNENTVNSEDADISVFPNVNPDDIDMVNSLLFGDFDPDLGIGTLELSDDEILKLNLNGILRSLSSPQKKASQSPEEIGFKLSEETCSSLPEKQLPLLDINTILAESTTPEKKDQHLDCENIDCSVSPEISMDPKIKLYLESMNAELSQKSHDNCSAVDGKTESARMSIVCGHKKVAGTSPINSVSLTADVEQLIEIKGKEKMALKEAEKNISVSDTEVDLPVNKIKKRIFVHEIKNNVCASKENMIHPYEVRENMSHKNEITEVRKSETIKGTLKGREQFTPGEKICQGGSQEGMSAKESDLKISAKETKKRVAVTEAKEKHGKERKSTISPNKAKKRFSSLETVKEVRNVVGKRMSAIEAKAITSSMIQVLSEKSPVKCSAKSFKMPSFKDGNESGNTRSERNDLKRRRFSERRNEQKKKKSNIEKRSIRTCRKLIQSFCELSSESEYSEDDMFLDDKWLTSSTQKKRNFHSNFIFPDKFDKRETLEPAPLMNAENFLHSPSDKSEVSSAVGDRSDNGSRKETGNENEMDIFPQQKNDNSEKVCEQLNGNLSLVDKHLSTTQKIPSETGKETVTQKQSEIPCDWNMVKPRSNKRKSCEMNSEFKDDPQNHVKNMKMSQDSKVVNGGEGKSESIKKAKKKKKGVKLKLTRSGEHYQVSETNTSVDGSDLNSSGDAKLHYNKSESICSDHSGSLNNSLLSNRCETSFTRKKKCKETKSVITPLRFTRHMSKDLSVSPELFQKLITLSPTKATDTSERAADEALGKKIEFEMMHINKVLRHSSENSSDVETVTYTQSSDHRRKKSFDNIIEEEWSVKNVPGSPTMKTFIRKQKQKYCIRMSPRIELSPLPNNQVIKKLITNQSNVAEVTDVQEHLVTNHLPTQSSPFDKNHGKNMQLSNPSFLSLVHLSVSPILSNSVPQDRFISESASQSQMKPKSSRRLYRSSKESYS
ncbi:uncharacterized protein [Panulirus ornatus]|uniref:uncharacterized protein n=1 Tax=Panulirus ornatus TaxID=150431 RepID=UPI003A840DF5